MTSYAEGDFAPALERLPGKQVIANEKIDLVRSNLLQLLDSVESLSKAIQGVAQVTEQSAAGSEEMASSSEELGAQASALRELVGAFNVG